jgi:GNAT superfamily N-acetyltransferase
MPLTTPLYHADAASTDAPDHNHQARHMQSISYRRAIASDIEALVQLRVAFLAEVANADPADAALRDALTRYFSSTVSTGEFIAFLALADNQPIASSGMVFHHHPPAHINLTGISAHIMNMYTAPAWRGRGIAGVLLNELIQTARQSSCPRVTLHALPKAASLYQRAGFVLTNDEMKLELP